MIQILYFITALKIIKSISFKDKTLNNNFAFSLIELIVGITISMILMVSVGAFISGGMQNIFKGQNILENTDDFISFSDNLNSDFGFIQTGSFLPVVTSSGIIFKRGLNYSAGGFTYIGTENINEIYCQSGSENPITKNIYIKNFIPFEEQTEDIFSDYYSTLTSNIINVGGQIYKSFQKEHKISIKNGANWDIIVGKGIFGDKFVEGANGTDIYINSPTGLTTDGTNLYISDTLNNRILYLDPSNKIHLLLDETSGLNEPTGLYYEDNSLYISNSGNGEILKYSSKSTISNKLLTLSGITATPINKVEIEFFNNDGISKIIAGPLNKTNITFSGALKGDDYLGIIGNKLLYYFVNYSGSLYSEVSCISNEEKLIGGNPIKCISLGTGQISTYQSKNLVNETININNIIPTFSNTGSYYVNLKLFNGTTEKYSKYFPYLTQSDDNLTTPGDNSLTILYSGINYPTGIWGSGTTDYNIFGDGTYSDLSYSQTDNVLNTPVKSLDINIIPNNLITVILKYFKNYNCYNLDDNIEKTFILKKNLKN